MSLITFGNRDPKPVVGFDPTAPRIGFGAHAPRKALRYIPPAPTVYEALGYRKANGEYEILRGHGSTQAEADADLAKQGGIKNGPVPAPVAPPAPEPEGSEIVKKWAEEHIANGTYYGTETNRRLVEQYFQQNRLRWTRRNLDAALIALQGKLEMVPVTRPRGQRPGTQPPTQEAIDRKAEEEAQAQADAAILVEASKMSLYELRLHLRGGHSKWASRYQAALERHSGKVA
jgi:hypothetical protein